MWEIFHGLARFDDILYNRDNIPCVPPCRHIIYQNQRATVEL